MIGVTRPLIGGDMKRCFCLMSVCLLPTSGLNIIFYLIILIICYVVFIAFNINHSSILPLMALNSLYCADVPLSNYSLTPLHRA